MWTVASGNLQNKILQPVLSCFVSNLHPACLHCHPHRPLFLTSSFIDKLIEMPHMFFWRHTRTYCYIYGHIDAAYNTRSKKKKVTHLKPFDKCAIHTAEMYCKKSNKAKMGKMKNGWRKIASIHKFKKTKVKKNRRLFFPL